MRDEDTLTLDSVWWSSMRLEYYVVSGKEFFAFRNILTFQGQVV